MTSTKCTVCGIGFFSPTGADKCAKCSKEAPAQQEHGSCGCGHDHSH